MTSLKQKIDRIATFDLLRGYLLIGIIIDHLSFFPNGLDWWSARGGLYVTMAEGFFLISGIVLGIVRGAKMVHEPFKKVAKVLLQRGLQLYITSVVLTLAFTLIGWIFYMDNPGLKPGIVGASTPFIQVVIDTVTLQYFYGWADYLRLYAVFLFAAPLAVFLLRKKLWYVLVALSAIIWFFYPDPYSISIFEREKLQLLSWQVLFFGGLIAGFYWPQLTVFWRKQSHRLRVAIKVSIVALAGVTLLATVTLMLTTLGYNFSAIGFTSELWHQIFTNYFNKESLPIARIALAVLWFVAAYIVIRRLEKPIIKFLGWILLPFGTNSLYVYTVHAILLFFLHLYFQAGNLWYNLLVSLVLIVIIYVMVRYKILMKIIPR